MPKKKKRKRKKSGFFSCLRGGDSSSDELEDTEDLSAYRDETLENEADTATACPLQTDVHSNNSSAANHNKYAITKENTKKGKHISLGKESLQNYFKKITSKKTKLPKEEGKKSKSLYESIREIAARHIFIYRVHQETVEFSSLEKNVHVKGVQTNVSSFRSKEIHKREYGRMSHIIEELKCKQPKAEDSKYSFEHKAVTSRNETDNKILELERKIQNMEKEIADVSLANPGASVTIEIGTIKIHVQNLPTDASTAAGNAVVKETVVKPIVPNEKCPLETEAQFREEMQQFYERERQRFARFTKTEREFSCEEVILEDNALKPNKCSKKLECGSKMKFINRLKGHGVAQNELNLSNVEHISEALVHPQPHIVRDVHDLLDLTTKPVSSMTTILTQSITKTVTNPTASCVVACISPGMISERLSTASTSPVTTALTSSGGHAVQKPIMSSHHQSSAVVSVPNIKQQSAVVTGIRETFAVSDVPKVESDVSKYPAAIVSRIQQQHSAATFNSAHKPSASAVVPEVKDCYSQVTSTTSVGSCVKQQIQTPLVSSVPTVKEVSFPSGKQFPIDAVANIQKSSAISVVPRVKEPCTPKCVNTELFSVPQVTAVPSVQGPPIQKSPVAIVSSGLKPSASAGGKSSVQKFPVVSVQNPSILKSSLNVSTSDKKPSRVTFGPTVKDQPTHQSPPAPVNRDKTHCVQRSLQIKKGPSCADIVPAIKERLTSSSSNANMPIAGTTVVQESTAVIARGNDSSPTIPKLSTTVVSSHPVVIETGSKDGSTTLKTSYVTVPKTTHQVADINSPVASHVLRASLPSVPNPVITKSGPMIGLQDVHEPAILKRGTTLSDDKHVVETSHPAEDQARKDVDTGDDMSMSSLTPNQQSVGNSDFQSTSLSSDMDSDADLPLGPELSRKVNEAEKSLVNVAEKPCLGGPLTNSEKRVCDLEQQNDSGKNMNPRMSEGAVNNECSKSSASKSATPDARKSCDTENSNDKSAKETSSRSLSARKTPSLKTSTKTDVEETKASPKPPLSMKTLMMDGDSSSKTENTPQTQSEVLVRKAESISDESVSDSETSSQERSSSLSKQIVPACSLPRSEQIIQEQSLNQRALTDKMKRYSAPDKSILTSGIHPQSGQSNRNIERGIDSCKVSRNVNQAERLQTSVAEKQCPGGSSDNVQPIGKSEQRAADIGEGKDVAKHADPPLLETVENDVKAERVITDARKPRDNKNSDHKSSQSQSAENMPALQNDLKSDVSETNTTSKNVDDIKTARSDAQIRSRFENENAHQILTRILARKTDKMNDDFLADSETSSSSVSGHIMQVGSPSGSYQQILEQSLGQRALTNQSKRYSAPNKLSVAVTGIQTQTEQNNTKIEKDTEVNSYRVSEHKSQVHQSFGNMAEPTFQRQTLEKLDEPAKMCGLGNVTGSDKIVDPSVSNDVMDYRSTESSEYNSSTSADVPKANDAPKIDRAQPVIKTPSLQSGLKSNEAKMRQTLKNVDNTVNHYVDSQSDISSKIDDGPDMPFKVPTRKADKMSDDFQDDWISYDETSSSESSSSLSNIVQVQQQPLRNKVSIKNKEENNGGVRPAILTSEKQQPSVDDGVLFGCKLSSRAKDALAFSTSTPRLGASSSVLQPTGMSGSLGKDPKLESTKTNQNMREDGQKNASTVNNTLNLGMAKTLPESTEQSLYRNSVTDNKKECKEEPRLVITATGLQPPSAKDKRKTLNDSDIFGCKLWTQAQEASRTRFGGSSQVLKPIGNPEIFAKVCDSGQKTDLDNHFVYESSEPTDSITSESPKRGHAKNSDHKGNTGLSLEAQSVRNMSALRGDLSEEGNCQKKATTSPGNQGTMKPLMKDTKIDYKNEDDPEMHPKVPKRKTDNMSDDFQDERNSYHETFSFETSSSESNIVQVQQQPLQKKIGGNNKEENNVRVRPAIPTSEKQPSIYDAALFGCNLSSRAKEALEFSTSRPRLGASSSVLQPIGMSGSLGETGETLKTNLSIKGQGRNLKVDESKILSGSVKQQIEDKPMQCKSVTGNKKGYSEEARLVITSTGLQPASAKDKRTTVNDSDIFGCNFSARAQEALASMKSKKRLGGSSPVLQPVGSLDIPGRRANSEAQDIFKAEREISRKQDTKVSSAKTSGLPGRNSPKKKLKQMSRSTGEHFQQCSRDQILNMERDLTQRGNAKLQNPLLENSNHIREASSIPTSSLPSPLGRPDLLAPSPFKNKGNLTPLVRGKLGDVPMPKSEALHRSEILNPTPSFIQRYLPGELSSPQGYPYPGADPANTDPFLGMDPSELLAQQYAAVMDGQSRHDPAHMNPHGTVGPVAGIPYPYLDHYSEPELMQQCVGVDPRFLPFQGQQMINDDMMMGPVDPIAGIPYPYPDEYLHPAMMEQYMAMDNEYPHPAMMEQYMAMDNEYPHPAMMEQYMAMDNEYPHPAMMEQYMAMDPAYSPFERQPRLGGHGMMPQRSQDSKNRLTRRPTASSGGLNRSFPHHY